MQQLDESVSKNMNDENLRKKSQILSTLIKKQSKKKNRSEMEVQKPSCTKSESERKNETRCKSDFHSQSLRML